MTGSTQRLGDDGRRTEMLVADIPGCIYSLSAECGGRRSVAVDEEALPGADWMPALLPCGARAAPRLVLAHTPRLRLRKLGTTATNVVGAGT